MLSDMYKKFKIKKALAIVAVAGFGVALVTTTSIIAHSAIVNQKWAKYQVVDNSRATTPT
jgi:methionine-rich copper-binding protein CopC